MIPGMAAYASSGDDSDDSSSLDSAKDDMHSKAPTVATATTSSYPSNKRKQERQEELKAARKRLFHVAPLQANKSSVDEQYSGSDGDEESDARGLGGVGKNFATIESSAADLFSLLPPPKNAAANPAAASPADRHKSAEITTRDYRVPVASSSSSIGSSIPLKKKTTLTAANGHATTQIIESSVLEPYPDDALEGAGEEVNGQQQSSYNDLYYQQYYQQYYSQGMNQEAEATIDEEALKHLGGVKSRADLERMNIKTISADERMRLNETEQFLLGEELERKQRGVATGFGHSDSMSRKHNLQWLLHFSKINDHYLGEKSARSAKTKGEVRKKYGF